MGCWATLFSTGQILAEYSMAGKLPLVRPPARRLLGFCCSTCRCQLHRLQGNIAQAVAFEQSGRLLEQHGWTLLRVQGSHHIYGKPGSVTRISVPVHGNKPLKIGLLKHLMKIVGLSENDL